MEKKLNGLSNLIIGILIIILGIILINLTDKFYVFSLYILVLIYLLYTLSNLINYIKEKNVERNRKTLYRIIVNFIFSILLLLFPYITKKIIPIIVFLYFLTNSFEAFIDLTLYLGSSISRTIKDIFIFIFFFIFSIEFLKYSLTDIKILYLIFGIYSIILGINRIILFIYDLILPEYRLKLRKKIRITYPLFVDSFLPLVEFKKISKSKETYIVEGKSNKKPNLEIIIHLSNYAQTSFGHTDICFDSYVYSYGHYDKYSRVFNNMIGDGVFYKVKKDDYIDFITHEGRKSIIVFGIDLNETEEANLRLNIGNMFENTYKWYKGAYYHKKEYLNKDFTSKLYTKTHATFYKFNSGKFKKYFVLSSNCTKFVDTLLESSGIDIVKFSSIITPGTYFEYLNNEYKYKNSKVISKTIYKRDEKYVKNKKKI